MVLVPFASIVVLATTVAVPALAHASPSGGCVLKITRFAFHPKQVHAGDLAKLWLVAKNCTDGTLDLTQTEYGEWIPPCPAVDPIGHPVTIGPHGRYAPRPLKMIAPPCNGQEVMVVTFQDPHGSLLATRTATLTITDPSP